jgi:Zn-dependent protease with chaperone function
MRSFAFVLLLILPCASAELDYQESKLLKIRYYKGREYTLLPMEGSSIRYYASLPDGVQCNFSHRKSNLFPIPKAERVTIRTVKASKHKFEIIYVSDDLGKGSTTFRWPFQYDMDPEKLDILISNVLVEEASFELTPAYLVNRKTGMIHLKCCNHCKMKESVPYSDIETAVQDGYKKCPACFVRIPRVSNHHMDLSLGRQIAAEIRSYNPVSLDMELQNRLKSQGEMVLEAWPFPLRGYNYRFAVVESPELNAMAAPDGQIFITDTMMKSFESDEEMEAVLAHEITHVEKRHGYREYVRAKRNAKYAAIAAAFAGVAVQSMDTDSSGAAAGVAAAFTALAMNVALSGYSVELEEEADAFAMAYFPLTGRPEKSQSMVDILKKAKFAQEAAGIDPEKRRAFATHPHINRRLRSLIDQYYVPCEKCRFCGLDKEGDVVAYLYFDIIRVSTDERVVVQNNSGKTGRSTSNTRREILKKTINLQVFATVETTSALGESSEIKSAKVNFLSDDLKLDNKEDTEIFPNDSVGVVLIKELKHFDPKQFNFEILSVDMKLRNVNRWVKKECLMN